ncbi:globin family protein [Emticicia sp. BO119]|uniref:globin family protein n=1 Tax=Emticicia sp. BO119 TaxID=2757768 RepID=UPI0015F07B53|nr:globin family protein [Emticicia sp. BO119]MBA4853906.1 hemin receptor [Emticicia sp. BO119]
MKTNYCRIQQEVQKITFITEYHTDMKTNQILLVKESFSLVAKIPAETVGNLFYTRLFEIAPELKPMFRNADMTEQSRKLLSMLSYIISKLNNLETILDDVARLSQRHVKYGVQDYHYEKVGEALLWTLEQGLGKNWTEDTQEAWVVCYTLLSRAMKEMSQEVAV